MGVVIQNYPYQVTKSLTMNGKIGLFFQMRGVNQRTDAMFREGISGCYYLSSNGSLPITYTGTGTVDITNNNQTDTYGIWIDGDPSVHIQRGISSGSDVITFSPSHPCSLIGVSYIDASTHRQCQLYQTDANGNLFEIGEGRTHSESKRYTIAYSVETVTITPDGGVNLVAWMIS